MYKFLKNLKPATKKPFDFYQCIEDNKHYRTNVINDFFLKCKSKTPGRLTRDEFVTCILLGFWDRYVYDDIDEEPEMEMQQLRWEGLKDRTCDRVKEQFTLAKPVKK
jgi:hypothetical protein